MTTFNDLVYQAGGLPVFGGLPLSNQGKVYFVDGARGSASGSGSFESPLNTISAALALCVSGQHDTVVLLSSATAVNESSAILWNKNLTHLIGLGAPNLAAQRTRIVCNAAGAAMSPFITVSGYGCIFSNLYVWQGQADASTLINVKLTGQRSVFHRVHFAGGGHATQAVDGGASLEMGTGASENLFEDCTFGVDTVNASTGLAAVLFDAGAGCARNVFRDCRFTLHAAGTTPAGVRFIEVTDDFSIDRYTIFERCLFSNFATAMTSAFVFVGGMDASNKRILLKDCGLLGATDWDSGNTGICYLSNGTITGGGNAGLFAVSNST